MTNYVKARTNETGYSVKLEYDLKIGTGGFGDSSRAYHTAIENQRDIFIHIYTKHVGAIDIRKMDACYYTMLNLLKRFVPKYTLETDVEFFMTPHGHNKIYKINTKGKGMLCVSKIAGKIYAYFENGSRIEKINL